MSEKPIIASAMFFVFSVLPKTYTSENVPASTRPSEPSGSAIRPLPSVVPMLAPIITLMAGRSAITPALTKPTTITVKPLTGVPAILASSARMRCAARLPMPLDMNSNPSMNRPRPPMTGTRISLNRSTCMRCFIACSCTLRANDRSGAR